MPVIAIMVTSGRYSGRSGGASRGPAQDLRRRASGRARPGRCQRHHRTGPVHRRDGPFGLGQVDAHALHGRPGPAHVGAGVRGRPGRRPARRRRAHPAAPRQDRLRLPVLQPGSDADRGREHHAARRPGRDQGGPGVARLPGGAAGYRGPPHAPARRAVRRPAAAGGVRAGPDQPAGPGLRRRAHRQPRLELLGRRPDLPAAVGQRAGPVGRDGDARPARRRLRGPGDLPGRRGRGQRARPAHGRLGPRAHAHAGELRCATSRSRACWPTSCGWR
jgi:hypothetical protein